MPFSVSEYAHRSFDHLYAAWCRDPAAALQRATDAAGVALRVESGPMLMSALGMATAQAEGAAATRDRALWAALHDRAGGPALSAGSPREVRVRVRDVDFRTIIPNAST